MASYIRCSRKRNHPSPEYTNIHNYMLCVSAATITDAGACVYGKTPVGCFQKHDLALVCPSRFGRNRSEALTIGVCHRPQAMASFVQEPVTIAFPKAWTDRRLVSYSCHVFLRPTPCRACKVVSIRRVVRLDPAVELMSGASSWTSLRSAARGYTRDEFIRSIKGKIQRCPGAIKLCLQ